MSIQPLVTRIATSKQTAITEPASVWARSLRSTQDVNKGQGHENAAGGLADASHALTCRAWDPPRTSHLSPKFKHPNGKRMYGLTKIDFQPYKLYLRRRK
jgi:hypothetical protein